MALAQTLITQAVVEPSQPDTNRSPDLPPNLAAARLVGRAVHPWAWWAWAISCAVAVGLTTNPWQLLGLGVALLVVVLLRRPEEPWARSLRFYLSLAGFVVVIRLFFAIVVSGIGGTHVLFTLPQVKLPAWAAGIRLGGAVTLETLLLNGYDALRLALMLLCVGAANSLANPRRALRSVPAALYEISVAVVVGLTLAPQMVESGLRIYRAQRLRGDLGRGLRVLGRVAIPVLEDAVDRSLALAAGMEVRGFGRTRRRGRDPVASAILLISVVVLLCGVYLVLASTGPWWAGVVISLGGAVLGGYGLTRSGRRLNVTTYRPDPWRGPEWLVVGCGLAAAVLVGLCAHRSPGLWVPSTQPPVMPGRDSAMLLSALLVALPGVLTPTPPSSATLRSYYQQLGEGLGTNGYDAPSRAERLRPRVAA